MPAPLPNKRQPDALELFTDRVEEQKTIRHVLQPPLGDALGRQSLLTVFYGVGGVGKSTLCRQACKIAAEEFNDDVRVAVTSFDDDRWREGTAFTDVCAELCRCLVERKIMPQLTVGLLMLHGQQRGRNGDPAGGLDAGWSMAFTALDKGANASNIPGLGLVVDGLTLTSVKELSRLLNQKGDLLGAASLLREVAGRSPGCLAGVRYNLACYDCLSGNVEEAKRLTAEEIAAKPAAREQALKDDDLKAIRDFIRDLASAETASGTKRPRECAP
jgi:hypothetical protein